MADIPSSLVKMNDVEVAGDAPHSEALMEKIGANLNGLIDEAEKIWRYQDFTANGSFVVPAGVTMLEIEACGGGGGGAGGGATGGGGGGGGGAVPTRFSLPVTPGETVSVTIGSGGSGGGTRSGTTLAGLPGSNGDNTIIAALAGTLTFYGASGGIAGGAEANDTRTEGLHYTKGGGSGANKAAGQNSPFASGGSAGAGGTSAGGGGGAGRGAGGNGSASSTGGSASANTGGGGGGGAATGPSSGAGGGAGGSGWARIMWFGVAA